MRCDRLAKDQPPEIAMFRISEVQESPAFNGRRSFLTLRERRKPSGRLTIALHFTGRLTPHRQTLITTSSMVS
jgi:hypothetical protein